MIEIRNLHKKFGKLQVLRDVELTFRAGECIALIGPNGCGKTTLIKTLLGMVIPDHGTILFNGKPVGQSVAYRAQIGYMPQIGRYPENMTVGQMLSMIRSIRKSATPQDTDLLKAFDLDNISGKRMRTLSGGTRQKVGAMLAFLFDPDVLLLDEPTAGLDPLSSEILKDKMISSRERGKLILITSHLLSELDTLVTQVVFMHEGAVRFHLDTADLMSRTGEQSISRGITQMMKSSLHG